MIGRVHCPPKAPTWLIQKRIQEVEAAIHQITGGFGRSPRFTNSRQYARDFEILRNYEEEARTLRGELSKRGKL